MKVSVIVPAYNSSATIKASLESAIGQSYPVHEILVINDGSVDHTGDLVQQLIKTHTDVTIRYHNKMNEGPSVARNMGIKMATGDLIAFLDSDDVWLKDKLKLQVDVLKAHPEIALLGGLYQDKNKGNKPFKAVTFKDLLLRNSFFTSATVVRRSVFNTVKPFNENKKYSEDYNLWLRILTQFNGGVLNEVVFSYASETGINDDGLSGNLWLMEKGELDNYKEMYALKHISTGRFIFLIGFSLLKFSRRLLKKIVKK